MAETSGPASRRFDIDNLRNLAVLALLFFHTARLFDEEPWHMKDAHSYAAADRLVEVMNQWHMPLFFLLAGMSAWLAISRHGAGRFIGDRFRRLFVPLLFGIVVAVLPQVYLERISPQVPLRQSPIDFDGNLFEFVPAFFSSCCYEEGNFSWHHLWFLVYLLLYSLLAAPLFLAMIGRAEGLARWLGKGWRILLLGLPPLVALTLLRPYFPSTHALIDDWADHPHFFLVVVAGGLIASDPQLNAAAVRLRRPVLALAVLATLLVLPAPEWTILPGAAGLPASIALFAAGEWLWLVALLGFAGAHLDRRVPWLTAFSRYALPFYVFHQAFIIAFGWLGFGWQDAPLVKYAAIVVASGIASYLAARLLDLSGPTRFLIGLKGPPRPAGATGERPPLAAAGR